MAKKNSIESAAISFNSEDDGSFSCELRSNLGRVVRVAQRGDTQSPEVEGDAELTGSPAIVDALWLAAVGQKESDDFGGPTSGSRGCGSGRLQFQ